RIMNECRHYEQIIELYCEIPKEMQQDGKLLFFLANAYARIGEIEKAEEILYKNGCLVVPDIREGETSLTSLWLYIEECKCKSQGLEFDENTVKIPAFLDYQMGSATV
ncbi:MAG: tetratricopeptide repeat protein, partial [Oscillospiraceae bacterium]